LFDQTLFKLASGDSILGATLLATKNYIPVPQAQWIDRERLVARLNAGLENHHRLTLISASAGAGKSSLLAEWAATEPAMVGWVSLDSEDNDPIRFWTYCLAAIQVRCKNRVQTLIEALQSPQPPVILPFLNEIVNQLASLPVEKLVLVLDDYHVIDTQSIHDSLGYFVDHIPPNIHLVIATRSDPPLPLHRWRGRGQLTEIRFDDLRFTLMETQLFLTERMKLDLNFEDIEQLEKRTEGWIVGLHLAALLMKGNKDPGAFIARFSSNNHYILEYLTSEVLDLLPDNEQDFLLQISILSQFNPSLCDAVTGRTDSQAYLDRFWKANLFLIPLDDEHVWYRYHHLFADLLGHKLKQKGETCLQPLYQRAADWYAQNQMIDEAIRSGLAARNYAMAGELVLKNRRRSMSAGNFKRPLAWMEQFPAEVLASDARLSLVYAVMLYNNGQTAFVEKHLDNAKQAYERLAQEGNVPADDTDYATLPGLSAAFRALLALRRWNLPAAAQFAEESLRISSPQDLHSQGLAGMALGLTQSEMGMFEESIQTFRRAILTCEGSGNSIGATVCYQQLASLLQIQGRLKEAEATYETALEQAAYRHQEQLPATGVLLVGQAEIWYEKNQLAKMGDGLEKGLALIRQGGQLDIQKTAAVLKAKLSSAAGNLFEAVHELRSAQEMFRKNGLGLALTELNAYLAQYYGFLGKMDEAATWADRQDAPLNSNPGFTKGIELFCLARVWIRLEKWEDVRKLLIQLESYALESKSLRRQAEALLLHALIEFQQNNRSDSFDLLEKSILLGIKQGYVRFYLDEGEPVRELLLAFQKNGHHDALTDSLVQDLLAGFMKNNQDKEIPETMIKTDSSPAIRTPAQPLVEKLSERELEVLGLMSEGLTNPEIAKRLILSVSTVKTHLINIYGKLTVRNRAEAVLRAKDLGLL
jgi:LuxR family transcriptional regulator, maltose regulon positive regulatory protein